MSVALLRRADPRAPKEILRARIETLRRRAAALAEGDITPRQIKDDALWMCPSCQRLMVELRPLDRQEMQRRIHEEVQRLARAS